MFWLLLNPEVIFLYEIENQLDDRHAFKIVQCFVCSYCEWTQYTTCESKGPVDQLLNLLRIYSSKETQPLYSPPFKSVIEVLIHCTVETDLLQVLASSVH